MQRRSKLHIITFFVYTIIVAGIFFEVFSLAKHVGLFGSKEAYQTYNINIEGNVRKPGWYVVPEGTTQFEILKVAGVRPTSDLSLINLASQIQDNQSISIGTLDKPVSLSTQTAYLGTFFGDINLFDQNGNSKDAQEGQVILPGDKIQSQSSSQAEISIGSFSKVNIDNFSELVIDKIYNKEGSKTITEFTQNSGSCWFRVVYSDVEELYRIFSRSVVITIGGSGADFLLNVQNDQIIINVFDGLLLIERRAGGESTNLISGQSATIYGDERPFQITKLSADVSLSEQFSKLTSGQTVKAASNAPLNIFFSVSPGVYYIINLQFSKGLAYFIRIPQELLVEKFAQNISTFGQAYLYGGPVFVSSLLERLFNTRIQKYLSFSKDDIFVISDILGGFTVDVDAKASASLGIPLGKQKMNSSGIIKFLSNSVSGASDAQVRQTQVLLGLFEELRNQNTAPTLLTANQIISTCETNFTAQEIIDRFTSFNGQTDWVYKEVFLPTATVKKNGRNCYDPDLNQCRRIISDEKK